MTKVKTIKNQVMKHKVLYSILLAEILAIIFGIIETILNGGNLRDIGQLFPVCLLMGILIIYPIILTIINIVFVFVKSKNEKIVQDEKVFEYITIVLGLLFSSLAAVFYEINFNAGWNIPLINNEIHTPIFTESYGTIIVIAFIAIIGYFVLSKVPIKKMPPLVTVICIAAMYIGVVGCILWIVQIFNLDNIMLCLLALNLIIIAFKTTKQKVRQWSQMQNHEIKLYKYKILNSANEKLMNSNRWPVMAFLIMWPLLGILICILSLFGQRPDAAIRAWTETSDWNLSKKIAPQNIVVDQHYLCTVAAGGHRKIVKPFRKGIRHDHEVVVNRQLCVANAFEQILEERTPRFHSHIRSFYDNYGFPIAKLIHSPYTADAIYFLMKPLEWMFLIVLYTFDVKPENRIAVQYIVKKQN